MGVPIDPDVVELADLVLSVARKITVRGHADPQVIVLTPLESLVLRHLHEHPGSSPSSVAREAGLTTSNMSAALRSLVAKGLVQRCADPGDGRSLRLFPTACADENFARVSAEWTAMLAPLIAARQELAGAVRVLRELDRGLSGSPEAEVDRDASTVQRGDDV
jgi:DNA-binding MarR family transcriptional regulator